MGMPHTSSVACLSPEPIKWEKVNLPVSRWWPVSRGSACSYPLRGPAWALGGEEPSCPDPSQPRWDQYGPGGSPKAPEVRGGIRTCFIVGAPEAARGKVSFLGYSPQPCRGPQEPGVALKQSKWLLF